MAAPAECSHSLPSVWSKCQCVLIKCLIGSELIDASADVIFGRAPAKPASISSLPSRPVRTAIFPPAPIRTLMLPRSFWTVTLLAAAVLRAVCTSPSFWAKTCHGAIKATENGEFAEARKLRREIRTSNFVVIQDPFYVPGPSVRDFVHRELSHGGCGRHGGLAVGHGVFERDPGDLERLQECRCRVAEHLVGVSATGRVQCADAEVPDYLNLRPAGRCLHVAERHHPAVVGFMYIGHIVLHHEGTTDHLHVDRHRPAIIGRCCSGGDKIRWCATLVFRVGQVQ